MLATLHLEHPVPQIIQSMDPKKRKIMSRIGAALLLGMSLFNFGTIWNKQKGGTLPRKTQQQRKKEQENLGESQEVAEVASEEAEAVIAQVTQEQESEQQLQRQTTTFSEKVIRYGAVGLWTVSAGVVFSSVTFNQPFDLGKKLLSYLPGNLHLASFELVTEGDRQYYNLGEEIAVSLKLDGREERVRQTKVNLGFDSERLELDRYQINFDLVEAVPQRDIDFEFGKVELVFQLKDGSKMNSETSLVKLYFKAKEKGQTKIGINQTDSFVLKKEEDGLKNILGRVEPVVVRVTDK